MRMILLALALAAPVNAQPRETVEQTRKVKLDSIQGQLQYRIQARWPTWKLINCALGLYDDLPPTSPDYPATIKSEIKKLLVAEAKAEADVKALSDAQAIKDYVW